MRVGQLNFDGLRLPAVSVRKRDLAITVRGHGRRWSADRPSAAFRVFAELDLSSKPDIEMFLARYGDPVGLPGAPNSRAAEWTELHAMLGTAATTMS